METSRKLPSSWHAMPADAVIEAVRSHPGGLSSREAEERLEIEGPNVLPSAPGPGMLKLLGRQLGDPLIYVLIASAGLAFLLGHVIDGAVVLGVVILNTLIGFVQEVRANRAIAALIDLVPQNAHVIREGMMDTLPAVNLVSGDIVLLQPGDKVPADLRLLDAQGLRIEEASLTGEAEQAVKSTDPVEPDVVIGDRRNMAYSGTMVTAGTGRAVVVATGGQTELGRISSLLRQAEEIETPLTRQLAKVGKVLTLAIAIVAALIFGVGLWRGFSMIDAVLAGITLAVAAIPEGLPAIITIALAIGVQRMARRHAVIRKLPAVETLGSTTVICSDKTGTLTRGEMTVQALWTPGSGHYQLTGSGYVPEGELRWEERRVAAPPGEVERLLMAGTLCNDAALRYNGEWSISGDPTEAALLVAAQKVGMDTRALRLENPRSGVLPFASERQCMATRHPSSEGTVVYLKGAPEVVLRRCERQANQPAYEAFVLNQVEELASKGLRVLAFATKRLPTLPNGSLPEEAIEDGFELLGLQAMIDPPRDEAIEAIEACRDAGIEVKMITGDHRITAEAIGRQLGLLTNGERAFTGEEIAATSDDDLLETARRVRVFARVAPEHKMRLVRSLQTQRKVVAMTGDGVNDAPALKQADIGVAMGITGTAVSKEAADMVLADDNFASIAAAVEEGRRVYDNLIKSLAFVLPTNIGEALIILFAVLFFPVVAGEVLMPMLPVQILWINLVATVTLALPLAFEAMEPGVMRRPPRLPTEPLLNRFIVFRTFTVALLMTAGSLALFLYEYHLELQNGATFALAVSRAQTAAVTTVILFQCFYLVQCRSLKGSVVEIGIWSNPWVYLGIALLLVLQAGFVYVPIMHRLFGSAPLDADAWLKATLAALVVLPVIYAEKRWRRWRTARL